MKNKLTFGKKNLSFQKTIRFIL